MQSADRPPRRSANASMWLKLGYRGSRRNISVLDLFRVIFNDLAMINDHYFYFFFRNSLNHARSYIRFRASKTYDQFLADVAYSSLTP